MAGKVFFRSGAQHVSRIATYSTLAGVFKKEDFTKAKAIVDAEQNLHRVLVRLAGKRISRQEFMFLVRAIAIARAENELQKNRATRKDALAQLKAMLRLKDDDLLHALGGCDRMTYEAVQQAQIDAISDVLWRDGVFVDVGGVEYLVAPSMELGVELGERVPPYLPMGFEGVRIAIADALKSIEADDVREDPDPSLRLAAQRTRFHPRVGAGNAERSYQLDLAHACLLFWKKHVDPNPKPNVSPRTGKGSPDVEFAVAAFSAAGMPLSSARVRDVLKKAK